MIIHIPAPDAVKQSYTFGRFSKIKRLISHKDLSSGGSGGIADSFKLKTGIDIGIYPVPELADGGRVQNVISRGKYDAAHFHLIKCGGH